MTGFKPRGALSLRGFSVGGPRGHLHAEAG
jgi:hypothetical protein